MKRSFALLLGVVVLGSTTTSSAGLFDFLKPKPFGPRAKRFQKPDGPPILRRVAGKVVPGGEPVAIVLEKRDQAKPVASRDIDEPNVALGQSSTSLSNVSLQVEVPPEQLGGPILTSEAAPAPAPELVPQAAPVEVIQLFHCVSYEDLDHIHPCAVRTVVAVKDPTCCPDPCGCCTPGCVYVEICVPPCCPYKYEVKRRDHSKIEYDYGRYEIEITSRDGVVHVDYDH